MTSRRDFLRVSSGCVAHVLLSSAYASVGARHRWTAPLHPTVSTTPFAHLDAIGPDTWAVISTPLGGDRTTFGNGGIIAGRSGVIAVEGFYRPAGATWLAERARELTGRWPTHVVLTHVVLTHYHLDPAARTHGQRSGDRGRGRGDHVRRRPALERHVSELRGCDAVGAGGLDDAAVRASAPRLRARSRRHGRACRARSR